MIIQVSAFLFTAVLMLMFAMYDITQLRYTYYIRKIQTGQLTILIWCIAVLFKIISPTHETTILFYVFSKVTLLFIAYVVHQFTYVVRYSNHPKLGTLRIILFVPVVTSIAYVFCGVAEIEHYPITPLLQLIVEAIALTYYLSGNLFFVINLLKTQEIHKRQKAMYFFTVIVSTSYIYTISLLDTLKINIEMIVSFLPLYFLALIWVTRHFRLYDPMPTLITEILEHRDYSIIVLNSHLDVVDYNTSFITNLVDMKECKNISQIINNLEPYITSNSSGQELYRKITASNKSTFKGEISLVVDEKETVLSYYCSSIYGSKEHKIATLITFRNLTEQVMLQRSIEESNKRLEIANLQLREHLQHAVYLSAEAERERLMKEINHVFGHTMTEILSMLEADYMMLEQDEEDNPIEMGIDATLTRARSGLNEIRGLVSKYKKGD